MWKSTRKLLHASGKIGLASALRQHQTSIICHLNNHLLANMLTSITTIHFTTYTLSTQIKPGRRISQNKHLHTYNNNVQNTLIQTTRLQIQNTPNIYNNLNINMIPRFLNVAPDETPPLDNCTRIGLRIVGAPLGSDILRDHCDLIVCFKVTVRAWRFVIHVRWFWATTGEHENRPYLPLCPSEAQLCSVMHPMSWGNRRSATQFLCFAVQPTHPQ